MQVLINFVLAVLVVNTLMRKEGLEFSVYNLFYIYIVVCLKWEPNTHLSTGNHYLRLQNNQQLWSRLVTNILDKELYLDDFV